MSLIFSFLQRRYKRKRSQDVVNINDFSDWYAPGLRADGQSPVSNYIMNTKYISLSLCKWGVDFICTR